VYHCLFPELCNEIRGENFTPNTSKEKATQRQMKRKEKKKQQKKPQKTFSWFETGNGRKAQ